jgi:hypothetical protein
MNNLDKLAEMLQSNPELQEKINAEVKRLAESGEATGLIEGLDMAINNILGIDLTDDEIKVFIEESGNS